MYSEISSDTCMRPAPECIQRAVFTLRNSPQLLQAPAVVLEYVHIHKLDTKCF